MKFTIVAKSFLTVPFVLGLCLSSNSFAQETEMKHSGEFRVRYLNNRNTTAQETNSTTNQESDKAGTDHRFKLNLTARRGESLQAGLSLIHASGWGESNDPALPTSANGGTGINSSRDEYDRNNGIIVSRAWGWWKANDAVSFRFGRVGLEFADGAVFSENDWEQFPVSHDGVLGFWDITMGRFTVFGIKNRELGAGYRTSDAEENMYGFAFDFKRIPAFIKIANIHFLQITQDETPATTTPTSRDNRQHLGVTVGGDSAGFLYKATGAYQLGKTKGTAGGTEYDGDNNAWMVDSLLGYQLASALGLKMTVAYHHDTGDKNTNDRSKNEAYNPLFYDRHNYAGLMDVIRWGNLSHWTASLSFNPMDDVEAGFSFYDFDRSTTGSNASATNYGPNFALTELSTEKDIGSEVDAFVNKTYSASGFQIGGRFGAFFPGDAHRGVVVVPRREVNIYQWFLQAALVF